MDSNLFSLYQETQALRCLQPFQVRLTASIAVGHATGREHVQVCVPTVSGVRESTDGIGSTPMPATQPHPLVMVGHTTPNKQRKHIMNENKPKVATWALCVDIDPDNPEMLDGLHINPMGDIRDGRP